MADEQNSSAVKMLYYKYKYDRFPVYAVDCFRQIVFAVHG